MLKDLQSMTTEELQAIIQADAENLEKEPDMTFLMPILEELTRRRQSDPNAKTVEQAHREFQEHYAPKAYMLTGSSNLKINESACSNDRSRRRNYETLDR